ncbi:MAG: hypothetical protein ACPLPR_10290, partial [Bacillota bacterium]
GTEKRREAALEPKARTGEMWTSPPLWEYWAGQTVKEVAVGDEGFQPEPAQRVPGYKAKVV